MLLMREREEAAKKIAADHETRTRATFVAPRSQEDPVAISLRVRVMSLGLALLSGSAFAGQNLSKSD